MSLEDLKLITVKQTCSLLDISVPTIYRWYANGKLPFPKIKIGPGAVRFKKSDVVEFIEEQAKVQEQPEAVK